MPGSIGVVLPSCDYARYLPERFASIRQQTRRPAALVFLDDASTDGSWEVAAPFLANLPCRVVAERNDVRSGAVLGQWQAGVERLDTDFVWIAEADDRAAPGLLAALAARLESDEGAVFAFCDSSAIDADGVRTEGNSKAFYRGLGQDGLLEADATFTTEAALGTILCPRNLVLNASAVLWRAGALRRVLARLAPELGHWRAAGDWRTYAEACRSGGRVHYVAEPLNEHRRHAASVTGSQSAPRRYAELVAMMALLRGWLGPDAARDAAMRTHLADLRRDWRLDAVAA